ncbi:MAG TPA: alcohol dehydrogenase catalytic domain-containing protein [Kofleriaceae bacterium]|nr:alcohol dehydrogenase catalytic domain-containing protein [Kofleriaceae bacterium]
MRALVKRETGVALEDRALEPGDGVICRQGVIVDIAYAGVCRTDLAVADGAIAVADGRVLGHELSGWVDGVAVTVIPFDGRSWLGIDRDGAFADRVRVPASSVLALPDGMSLRLGAYVEPVAAALGVVRWIERDARVLVDGTGRIAELSARVVAAHGARVDREPDGTYDVVIEHGGATFALVSRVKTGGTLLLKSRARRAIALDAGELVARELTVRGVSHGSFEAAIDWLHGGRIAVDDLLAEPRPLEDFEAVFAAARESEACKQLFAIGARD